MELETTFRPFTFTFLAKHNLESVVYLCYWLIIFATWPWYREKPIRLSVIGIASCFKQWKEADYHLLFVKFSFSCKQVDYREQIRQVKVCQAETSILLLLCCSNPFFPWTFWCSNIMGQKWGAYHSGWWFLWRWWFSRGIGKPYTTGWEVCFPFFKFLFLNLSSVCDLCLESLSSLYV